MDGNTAYVNRHAKLIRARQTRMQFNDPAPAAIYTGIGNAISTISRAEGYMSLWRGVSSVVLGAGEKHGNMECMTVI